MTSSSLFDGGDHQGRGALAVDHRHLADAFADADHGVRRRLVSAQVDAQLAAQHDVEAVVDDAGIEQRLAGCDGAMGAVLEQVLMRRDVDAVEQTVAGKPCA